MISDIHYSVLSISSKNKNTFYGNPYNFIVIVVRNNNCILLSVTLPKILLLKIFQYCVSAMKRGVPVLNSNMPFLVTMAGNHSTPKKLSWHFTSVAFITLNIYFCYFMLILSPLHTVKLINDNTTAH